MGTPKRSFTGTGDKLEKFVEKILRYEKIYVGTDAFGWNLEWVVMGWSHERRLIESLERVAQDNLDPRGWKKGWGNR